ncbi:hypothetical protein BO94DRAFT_45274 [Aspergillus sclerotioniger CBS 115572]|uniref:Uncharacterized protein n=1 Tax=Aspergillus sclerotioniger CBS 115572 TaxID=1450535 RepID=A0A317WUS5_9EURO|nr:hypothetical protein BO94DRAFT_45274 [Aspergillus sclerotioniger CBS 115572]PWY88598.1 hypothetical protein BO94DRAFT_45274 [Aspergillus sclerotioniger CBS 115572]
MRMRKGTHSCIACRHRKVRCIFPPDESDVCSHCARRGSAYIPQGVSPELDSGNGVTRQRCQAGSRSFTKSVACATPERRTPSGPARFKDALKHLRKRIAISLDSHREDVPTRGAGAVHGSDCAE